MSFVEDLNGSISHLKDGLAVLYERSKKQILSLLDKSNSSFVQLINVFKRDEELEETFVDSSKVYDFENLVYDKVGWTNSFYIDEVKFLSTYYEKDTHPMTMEGAYLIPGSHFSHIFLDRVGFWGYMRKDELEVTTSFSLTLDINPHEKTKTANRIYLRTNNVLEVEAFYRTEFGGNWISIGKQSGQHHVWTEKFDGVEVKFEAVTSVFAVSYVAVGNATYNRSGTLISTYYEVDDLRKLRVDTDSIVPEGTAIRKFIHVTDDTTADPPASGWEPWDEEQIVVGAETEYTVPVASGYLVPSGYIEDSLVLRAGYSQWDDIDTTDTAIVTEAITRLSTSYLDIPSGYTVIAGGVRSLYIGDSESRVEYDAENDYNAIYDTTNDTIRIVYVDGGRLPTIPEIQPTAEVRIRKPVDVIQRRTFVHLDVDGDIVVNVPTAGVTMRTLHIGDTIEDEITRTNLSIGYHTIDGRAGLNLIEFEDHDTGNPPTLVGTYTYFSSRYWQKRVMTPGPAADEFYMQPAMSGFQVISPESDLYLRYLVPTDANQVAVKFEFEGLDDVAPLLRGYELINTIDKV